MPSDPLDPPVPPARHPFQVWAMAAFIISGAGLLFAGPKANSLDELAPAWLRTTWALTILAGGLLGLAGARRWRDGATGLILERAGMIGLAGGCLAYGLAVPVVTVDRLGVADGLPRSAVASLLILAIGVAALQRARQVTRALARLEQMRPGPEARPHHE